MGKISSLKINKSAYSGNSFGHKIVCPEYPRPEYGKLSYVDSRCIGQLNPYAQLNFLPEQIAKPKNLEYVINKNPHLKALLKKQGYTKVETPILPEAVDNHMKTTAHIAGQICDVLRIPLEQRLRIIKAARLHDMGKIFIPRKILNDTKVLSKNEKKPIDIHTELGYHLLKTFKIDEKTLDLIKNHHNLSKNSSLEQQIVSISDQFSALTENRPYKEAFSKEKAMYILERGNFSKEVIDALKYVCL